MNISVLAKLPSADVMAPAAVAILGEPPKGQGGSWRKRPQEHVELSLQAAHCPAEVGPGCLRRNWERSLVARTSGRLKSSKPAPSAGCCPLLQLVVDGLVLQSSGPLSCVEYQPVALPYPTRTLPSVPSPSVKADNVPSCSQ